MALGPQLVLVSGVLNIVAQNPGVLKGNWLKLCGHFKTWYSESWGWVRDIVIIFNVPCACLINFQHSTGGNFHHT